MLFRIGINEWLGWVTVWLSWLTASIKWMAIHCMYTPHSLHVHVHCTYRRLRLAVLFGGQINKPKNTHEYLCVERLNWSLASHSVSTYFDRSTTIACITLLCLHVLCICTYIYICFLPIVFSFYYFDYSKTHISLNAIHILFHFNFCHWITQIEQFISYLSGWCTIYIFHFVCGTEQAAERERERC